MNTKGHEYANPNLVLGIPKRYSSNVKVRKIKDLLNIVRRVTIPI